MTVSLALREHCSVARQTQLRIKAVAESIGYVPDPMLSGLSAYRMARRPMAYHANIGWINGWVPPSALYQAEFQRYYAGAAERCRELGYGLEELRLSEINFDFSRLERMLRAKGISGLLIPPSQIARQMLNLDLSRFSAVRFGYSYKHPVLHTVTNAQFRTVQSTVHHVAALGYRRVGIVMNHDSDDRTGCNFLGGFVAGQEVFPKKDRIAPFYPKNYFSENLDEFRRWVRKYRVDCVIANGYWYFFQKSGIRAPEDVGYADMQLDNQNTAITGMHQNGFRIGAAAVDLLTGMVQRGETGIPLTPTHLHIEGFWFDGSTTRRVNVDTGPVVESEA